MAVRLLWKDRRFTVVALVALALGIGATSAIYTVIDSVLLRPLPFSEPNALVEIQSAARNGPGASSFADFQDCRARNRSLDERRGVPRHDADAHRQRRSAAARSRSR